MPTHNHVPLGDTVNYSTVPPTSGNHWPHWAKCGIYLEGLPDELLVHNLEHSNIVVSYHLDTEEQIARLFSVINSIPTARDWVVVRYYDRLEPGTVALTTWGMLEVMQDVDRGRIATFFTEFQGQLGPESIPC